MSDSRLSRRELTCNELMHTIQNPVHTLRAADSAGTTSNIELVSTCYRIREKNPFSRHDVTAVYVQVPYLCSTSAHAEGEVILTTRVLLLCDPALVVSVIGVSALRNRMTPSMASRMLVVRLVDVDPTCSYTSAAQVTA